MKCHSSNDFKSSNHWAISSFLLWRYLDDFKHTRNTSEMYGQQINTRVVLTYIRQIMIIEWKIPAYVISIISLATLIIPNNSSNFEYPAQIISNSIFDNNES